MSFLRRLFSGRESKELQHPVFGKLLLIPARNGSYWEGEPVLEGGSIGLAIETIDSDSPSDAQVQFFQSTVTDLDATFNLAAPILVVEYEKWVRAKFPDQWRNAFRFSGMAVPLGGLPTNPWELSYECLTENSGKLFTCYFQEGKPTHVSIDG
jgi:hypothetical protein